MSELRNLTERIMALNEDHKQEDRTFTLAVLQLLMEQAEENERRKQNDKGTKTDDTSRTIEETRL